MRIALIRREYITHIDGVNRFIALLSEGFYKLGHVPIILSWCFSEEVPRAKLEEWFKEVHGLDIKIYITTLRDKPCYGDPWTRILLDWFHKGGKLLKEEGIDVAIVNGVIPLHFKPKIAVAHGSCRTTFLYEKFILKILYSMYDHIVCVSRASELEYGDITKCNSIIPLPMKLELSKPVDCSRKENIVVHIGTRSIKNPSISVEAVKLVIIGTRTQYIKDIVRGLDFVETRFDINEAEKIGILRKARALILPSSGETFSYISLEAMACGTSPIVSQAVPSDVVIDGFNGVRISSYDPKDYADAIEKILKDERLWRKLSRHGIEFVRQFNYIEIARRYINIAKKLLGQ